MGAWNGARRESFARFSRSRGRFGGHCAQRSHGRFPGDRSVGAAPRPRLSPL